MLRTNVTIRTSSGWEQEINSADSYYSGLIDSIKEVIGCVPETITMPDIVEEQWNDWVKLRERLEGNTGDIIFLADIQSIALTLLTLPNNWMIYVVVDERSNKKERTDHYRSIGTYLRSSMAGENILFPVCKNKDLDVLRLVIEDPIYRFREMSLKNARYIHLIDRMMHLDYLNLHTGLMRCIGTQYAGKEYPEFYYNDLVDSSPPGDTKALLKQLQYVHFHSPSYSAMEKLVECYEGLLTP
jgi:hypothetical protein